MKSTSFGEKIPPVLSVQEPWVLVLDPSLTLGNLGSAAYPLRALAGYLQDGGVLPIQENRGRMRKKRDSVEIGQ